MQGFDLEELDIFEQTSWTIYSSDGNALFNPIYLFLGRKSRCDFITFVILTFLKVYFLVTVYSMLDSNTDIWMF